jgi:hypothetical protein
MRKHMEWGALILGLVAGPLITLILDRAWDHYSGRYLAVVRGEAQDRDGRYYVGIALIGALLGCAPAAVMRGERPLPLGVAKAALGALAGTLIVVVITLCRAETLGGPLGKGQASYLVSGLYWVPFGIVIGATVGVLVPVKRPANGPEGDKSDSSSPPG